MVDRPDGTDADGWDFFWRSSQGTCAVAEFEGGRVTGGQVWVQLVWIYRLVKEEYPRRNSSRRIDGALNILTTRGRHLHLFKLTKNWNFETPLTVRSPISDDIRSASTDTTNTSPWRIGRRKHDFHNFYERQGSVHGRAKPLDENDQSVQRCTTSSVQILPNSLGQNDLPLISWECNVSLIGGRRVEPGSGDVEFGTFF